MKKTTLYLGLNDSETKEQVITGVAAMDIINSLLLDEYNLSGATIHLGYGIYKHHDGSIVKENTIIIILMGIETEVIDSIIADLKIIFNQECILKEVCNVEYSFV